MLTFFSILLWLAMVVGALAFLGFLAGRFLGAETQPDAISFVTTTDGWRLALSRYRPREPLAGALPVVVAPGLGCSGAIFDLEQDLSLPRALASAGHEVWVLDFRGRGRSERPRLGGRRRSTWTFDDYVDFDVRAALDAVCRESGASQVQWIGVDLGALALLAGFSGGLGGVGDRVRSVVAIAAPAFFRRQARLLSPWLLRLLGLLNIEATLRVLAPLLGHLYPPPLSLLQNRDNIERRIYRRALVSAGTSFSRKEMAQYLSWLSRDAFHSADEGRDYRSALAAVSVPCLLISGPRDPLAPAEAMEATSQALASAEKVSLLASRVQGMSTNYGHLDLLIGQNAPRDVFPHILKWLEVHSGAEQGPRCDEEDGPGAGELFRPSSPQASHHEGPTDPLAEPDTADEADEPDDDLSWLQGDVPRVPPKE
jgi:pimeloyl-ACP methyl ester carboxylesterase